MSPSQSSSSHPQCVVDDVGAAPVQQSAAPELPLGKRGTYYRSLIVVGMATLTGMTFYETGKQTFLPNLSMWESHAITIVVSTLIAMVAGWRVLKHHSSLNQRLAEDLRMRTQLEAEQRRAVRDLNDTMAKLRVLRGMLPMCASCKKIRDDGGYWTQLETYLRDHSEADISHGICPDCVRKLYPEYEGEVVGEEQEPGKKGP